MRTVSPPTYNVRPKIARLLQSLGYLPIERGVEESRKSRIERGVWSRCIHLFFTGESLELFPNQALLNLSNIQTRLEHRWPLQSLHLIYVQEKCRYSDSVVKSNINSVNPAGGHTKAFFHSLPTMIKSPRIPDDLLFGYK